MIASHVAEFESPAPVQVPQHPPHHAYPPHPMHMMQHPHYTHNPYALPQPVQNGVKAEPMDQRYMLGMPYALPPLPGPTLNGVRPLSGPIPPHPGGQTGVISFPRQLQPQPAVARQYAPTPVAQSQPQTQQPITQPPQRIPQVDGPSESSEDDESPPPSQNFAPRSAHPSLAQPAASGSTSAIAQPLDSEAINSDLDDSDTEGEEEAEEGAAGESDIVFCTYDKVTRLSSLHEFRLTYNAGGAREKQVEVYPKGWDDPCKWKGLPLRKMHRVRTRLTTLPS